MSDEVLRAVAKLYVSMHEFDLEQGTFSSIKTNPYIEKCSQGGTTLQETVTNVMSLLAAPDSRQTILDFVDLSTLPERLADNEYISVIFEGNVHGWCNAKFIRIGDDTPVKRVMFIVENVNAQSVELERLKEELAEREKNQPILEALLDEYSTVCSVDLSQDTMEVYKIADRIPEVINSQQGMQPYSAALKAYCDQAVHPDDVDEVRLALSPSIIMKSMEASGNFSKVYRNSQGKFGEVKIIRTGDNSVLMGFVEKHDEIMNLNEQIYFDSLTKVRNRKFYDEHLADKICNGVVMADIDRFKDVNDQLGHACGDDALTTVASILSSNIRNSDVVIRYGGDEFIIVFPSIPFVAFKNKVEKLRANVEMACVANYPDLHLTMSFGASYGEDLLKDMLLDADKALYEAKKVKNKVTVYYHNK